ncbi:hypothetical protein BOX15_Mlig027316g4 [Macrostomum lignano]|uniref:H15 domain-containing protein n=2 Tax=Macrostomum lignano TaxID=282301 RepID=A0A1I8J307_9PLAT|nr:hypothetical protein BOX15_Mlig027316g3 [Macrostomum lignano]PAA65098.1 hypothetical protein BOX15_Mlig027316g2 [Macrostomum lignano]PAA65750.1 hypothetical protein BOX15_Mlig027316g1 [Macrostomum lignano]PAA76686.1 hypothetical protein BOX15_Mlig027316g4 [Macrostomum lignano]
MDSKPALGRDSTMAATAKVAKQILGKEANKLGDTRATTNIIKKTKLKRASTVQKVADEAKAFLGQEVSVNAGRKLRTRKPRPAAPAKPTPKRAGTMKTTAKEGRAFLKSAAK